MEKTRRLFDQNDAPNRPGIHSRDDDGTRYKSFVRQPITSSLSPTDSASVHTESVLSGSWRQIIMDQARSGVCLVGLIGFRVNTLANFRQLPLDSMWTARGHAHKIKAN